MLEYGIRVKLVRPGLADQPRENERIEMRIVILCTTLLAVCLLSEEVQGSCQFEGQELAVGTHYIDCKEYRCHENGQISGLACPTYQCREGEQIGYREEDVSKPYPECCAGPICKEH